MTCNFLLGAICETMDNTGTKISRPLHLGFYLYQARHQLCLSFAANVRGSKIPPRFLASISLVVFGFSMDVSLSLKWSSFLPYRAERYGIPIGQKGMLRERPLTGLSSFSEPWTVTSSVSLLFPI